jgi:hypothetical protein
MCSDEGVVDGVGKTWEVQHRDGAARKDNSMIGTSSNNDKTNQCLSVHHYIEGFIPDQKATTT